MKLGHLRKDYFGHYYLVPEELTEEFDELTDKMFAAVGLSDEWHDLRTAFDNKFFKYGIDHNDIYDYQVLMPDKMLHKDWWEVVGVGNVVVGHILRKPPLGRFSQDTNTKSFTACLYCGKDIFKCKHCGAPLNDEEEAEWRCPECDHMNHWMASKCYFCDTPGPYK